MNIYFGIQRYEKIIVGRNEGMETRNSIYEKISNTEFLSRQTKIS